LIAHVRRPIDPHAGAKPGWVPNIPDVSCLGDGCTASAHARPAGISNPDLRTLIWRTTNGATWARIPSPNPFGVPSELESVSCVTATKCRAVGDFGGNTLVLITSNGTSWFKQESPNRGDGANYLLSVDCETTSACTAVGLYYNRPLDTEKARTLVLRTIDARTWIPVDSPNPSPNTSDAFLNDVSCSGTTCVAVGGVDPSPATKRSFILRTTNGASWTRAATPTTTGETELHPSTEPLGDHERDQLGIAQSHLGEAGSPGEQQLCHRSVHGRGRSTPRDPGELQEPRAARRRVLRPEMWASPVQLH
jgi:hypothetical protein